MSIRLVSKLSVGLLVVAAALIWLATAARADRTRLTHAGVDGDATIDAQRPAISRNAQTGDLLVLWTTNEGSERIESGDVFAQVLDASGSASGTPLLISQRGIDPETEPLAMHPAATYNATNNEWLAVWVAEADVAGEMEIFGRVLSSSKDRILPTTLQPTTPPFRITTTGPAANANHDALHPSITWDSTNNHYLIVWQADASLDNKSEIHAQLLAADGTAIGTRQQLSSTGDADDIATGSVTPAVTFDATSDTFSVVWNAGDALYGRQLAASTLLASDVVQLSAGKAGQPHLATGAGSSLLVYTAKAGATFHAYAQPLTGDLALDGAPLQLSSANSGEPFAAFDAASNQYAVAWRHEGGTRLATSADIALRTIDPVSGTLGTLQTAGRPAWSQPGNYLADHPALIANNGNGSNGDAFMLVWQADGEVSREFEIYMAQLQASVPTAIQLTQTISGSAPVQLLLIALGGVGLMTVLLLARQRYAPQTSNNTTNSGRG